MNDQVLVKIVNTDTEFTVDNRIVHENRVNAVVEGFNLAAEMMGSPLRAIITGSVVLRAEFGLAKAA